MNGTKLCAGPTATLSASAATVASGGTVNLSWSSTNAASCNISNSVAPAFATGGATSGGPTATGPITATVTYTLNCDGATDAKTITVTGSSCTGTGPVSITASPTRIQSGSSATLNWTGSNISSVSCTIKNNTTGATVSTSPVAPFPACSVSGGPVSTGALTNQTAYTITCGALTQTAVVNVVPKFKEF